MQIHWMKVSILQLIAVRTMFSDTSDSSFNMIVKAILFVNTIILCKIKCSKLVNQTEELFASCDAL